MKKKRNSVLMQKVSECVDAKGVCPVDAISLLDPKVVLASSKIKATLDEHPELKPVLVKLSPKFKKMQTPALYETLARFASFSDAAKMTGISVCEILHVINGYLGVEDKLIASMPECINKVKSDFVANSQDITWDESSDRFIYNNDAAGDLVLKLKALKPQENIIIISVDRPDALLKVAEGIGLIYNIEEGREFRVSIFNSEEFKEIGDWKEIKESFDVLEVRSMLTDPFDIIIKKAYEVEEGHGFVLVQQFEPLPIINMLTEMGFEYLTEQVDSKEFRVYFYKTISLESDDKNSSSKVDVVIQSATPVAYPVIMRLLQSEKIRQSVNIKELKVWEETEKHLAWIANGKADISFSALITSAKLASSDIKIPALFVWDNFVLLSKHKVSSFADLKGQEIYTPLFKEAPPAKITKYLIEGEGLNADDFVLKFGTPFGRPEEIYRDFVDNKADTVILREPEASYALKIMKDRGEDVSVLSFNSIWNKLNPEFGSFPNAGLVLKGEFVRNNPELTKVFTQELKLAIDWVNNNKKDAAKLSFDMMRQPPESIELFLDRVNFNYMEGEPLVQKVKDYFEILNKHNIVDVKLDDEFLGVFR
ncbi:MAG: hypothetical protein B6229_04290 [Spirochaetaceae bacterium 4572_7]|nr:MAG: hypothetical protein B6229_04290 [Spirochaetaceae bacterium 4572_7]